jgi:hypothetical protein
MYTKATKTVPIKLKSTKIDSDWSIQINPDKSNKSEMITTSPIIALLSAFENGYYLFVN